MQTIYRIAVLALLTGLIIMLLKKLIDYLTRDKDENL